MTDAPANMSGQFKGHVLLVRIAYDPKTNDEVRDWQEQECFDLTQAGYLVTPAAKKGTADLEDNRNTVASQFYQRPQFTHLIMFDQDVRGTPGALRRLVEHDVDLVAGVYRKRVAGQGFAVRTLPGPAETVDPKTGKYKADGLIKIAGAPGGLLCMTRACIEKMVTAYSDHWYASGLVPGGRVWALFEFDVIDHERISEDMNFSRRWRELGGDLWADPHLELHHHGDAAFSGRYIDHLRQLGKLIEPGKMARIETPAAH